MATLVLTTVGGAIGGPIGAALGAIIGQQVDRTILFPPPARTGPRLTDLAVQTSRYGAQIPQVFGRARVAGTVIWATDLIETRSTGRAGKGQPATTAYSYAASFAVALSARPIRGVGRIWAEGKLLRGAAGDWKTPATFRLHLGDDAQAPDPLIASAVAAAPAHRGIAYAVFENLQLADFGNRIPSLTFEVIGDDVAPSIGAIARALGGDALTGEGPEDVVDGFAASGESVAGVLEMLATMAGGWFVPRGGGLALTNRAELAGAVTIEDAAVTRSRRPLEAVPVALSVQHYDPARDYQIGVQHVRRPGPGWRDDTIDVPAVIPAAVAKSIADGALRRRELARETIELRCDQQAVAIAPGDVVTSDALGGMWRVTSASIEGWQQTLSVTQLTAATPARPADPGQAVTAPDDVIGATILHAVELPALGDGALSLPTLAVMAAGTEPGWRRAALMLSSDGGASWSAAGGTAAPATMGVLATPLPRAPATLIDRRNTADVLLAHDGMTLESVTAAALDRGANLALIGDELIQFRDAVQIASRRWRLAHLLRGRRCTPPVAHGDGARFVLLERDAVALLPLAGARPGEVITMLASGNGDMDGPVSAQARVTGGSVAPPAPVALCATVTPAGVTVAWRRRTRGDGTWRDGGDVPLVEERERYRLRVVSDAGERSLVVDEPRASLDLTSMAGGATIHIAQIGTLATSAETSITIKGDQA